MIEIRNLNKSFEENHAINNLSCTLKEGIYGIVGQNGAGKSTTLRIISNVFYKDDGEVNVNGFDSTSLESRKEIFFLPDNPYFKSKNNLESVFNLYNDFYDIDKEKYFSLIKKFGLPLNQRLSNFSKGMRRQAFVALALSTKTKILMMDEPFDGIDPLVIEEIKNDLLKEKENGRLILLSGHNITTLERIVDSFIVISKGKVATMGTSDELSSTLNKYQAFFKNEISIEDLKDYGINVITFKKVGSIYNFVVRENKVDVIEVIKNNFDPILLETIPLDSDEIIAVQMLIAKEDNSNE